MKRPSGMSRLRYLRLLLGFGIVAFAMGIRRIGEWVLGAEGRRLSNRKNGMPAPTREDFESTDFEKRW